MLLQYLRKYVIQKYNSSFVFVFFLKKKKKKKRRRNEFSNGFRLFLQMSMKRVDSFWKLWVWARFNSFFLKNEFEFEFARFFFTSLHNPGYCALENKSFSERVLNGKLRWSSRKEYPLKIIVLSRVQCLTGKTVLDIMTTCSWQAGSIRTESWQCNQIGEQFWLDFVLKLLNLFSRDCLRLKLNLKQNLRLYGRSKPITGCPLNNLTMTLLNEFELIKVDNHDSRIC